MRVERIGLARLYLGDCREIAPTLERPAAVIADPPYGIGRDGEEGDAHRKAYAFGGWDAQRPSPEGLRWLAGAADAVVIWGGNYFADVLPPTAKWLVWDKGQRDFSLADAELAWTSRDKAVRCFNYSRGEAARDGRVRPTQKPLALMRWCLSLVPDAKTILDPFMGSGTTLVSAKLEGHHAVGIEINEAYCELAVKRLEQGVLF